MSPGFVARAITGGALIAAAFAACDDRHAQTPPPERVKITVTPETAATLEKASVRFTATVTGAADTGVAWSVVEGGAGGTIADDGTYTAPDAHGTFHVRAVSRADASAIATAAIDVSNVFPTGDGYGPLAVSGSSSDDVWVVAFGRHWHWDGSTWTVGNVRTGNGASTLNLATVWANGPKDVWEAGIGELTMEIRHWDGVRWNVIHPATGGFIFGLWGTSPSDMWAAGGTLDPIVHHWDGTVLRSEILAPGFGKATALSTIWGSGPDDVWAAGVGSESGGSDRGPAMFHWNGTAWSRFRTGLTAAPLGLWGSAANDVWTGGEDGFLAHWDGQAWTAVASGVSAHLWSVWGFASDDVWAVGDAGTILHWNGSTWSGVPSPATSDLRGVWGAAPDDVWIVGQGVILHLRGPTPN